MSKRQKRAALGVLTLLVLIALAVGLLWATNALGWRRWRIQEVQAFIGTVLPDSAADVQFATEAEPARIVWLRFTIPASDDVSLFIAVLDLPSELRQGFTPFPAPNPVEAPLTWWTPYNATTFSGLYANTGDQIVEVLADESSLEAIEVYVRAYAL